MIKSLTERVRMTVHISHLYLTLLPSQVSVSLFNRYHTYIGIHYKSKELQVKFVKYFALIYPLKLIFSL